MRALPLRVYVGCLLVVVGVAVAGVSHWMMQQRLLDQSSTLAAERSTELYLSSLKSEVEVSRMATAISAMRIFPSQPNFYGLGEALDVIFSRHRLATLSFSSDGWVASEAMTHTLKQSERVLMRLDIELALESLDLPAAWRSQAELAVLFNEVSRLALERHSRVKRDLVRETERFSQKCSSFIILALGSVVVGLLLLGTLIASRVRTDAVGDHELV